MEQIMEFTGNHPLLAGAFVLALATLAWTEISRHLSGFRELSPAQAVPMINSAKTVVVDISPAAEFRKAHIVGARNIPSSRLDKPDQEIKKLKDHPVLVVCKSGQSAQKAAAALVRMGVAEVAVLKGGMSQWMADHYPVTRN